MVVVEVCDGVYMFLYLSFSLLLFCVVAFSRFFLFFPIYHLISFFLSVWIACEQM